MPKRTDIKKIMVIGSGPTVIGQSSEFDWAGTQACAAFREAGCEIVLLNPNPATVMTDADVADRIYMEPLTLEYVARVLRRERPDAVVPALGGKTAFALALQLSKKGILHECRSELIGIGEDSIEKTMDRALFSKFCADIGEPAVPFAVCSETDGAEAAQKLGFPVMLRPAGAQGGGAAVFPGNEAAFPAALKETVKASAAGLALAEKSVRGWNEIVFEVLRDQADNVVSICSMENVDSAGINTGDAVIVTPCLSVPAEMLRTLRESSAKIVRALKICGACGVRFALSPTSSEYYVLGVRPGVSRTSALAAKATGYPIAHVTAKAALGMTLDEIMLGDRSACFDPAPDYVVTRLPRFHSDKSAEAVSRLGTQMKATGEVMAVGKTLAESLMKAVRSLDTGVCHIRLSKFDGMDEARLLDYVREGTDDRIFAVAQLFRLGADTAGISAASGLAPEFLKAVETVVGTETPVAEKPFDIGALIAAKKVGFSDGYIAKLWHASEREVCDFRLDNRIMPEYVMTDTCAKDDWSYIPCFYASYNGAGRHGISGRKKIIILGSGPNRIGQGGEFDYATVHAAHSVKKLGFEAIVVGDNPAAVSTDLTVGDKLYLEPLTAESIVDIAERERPFGVIAAMGGQTAINLAAELEARGIALIGTGVTAITLSEDRDSFEKLLLTLGIPQPLCRSVTDADAGAAAAAEAGYPVLARLCSAPCGRAIVGDESALRAFLGTADIGEDAPAFIDKYIEGREIEVDAVCDGADVFIPGIMEHVERTGIHSGDSISIYPTFSVSEKAKGRILEYTRKLGLALGGVGLINVQFIVDKDDMVYVIEASARASRTVPFLSKATGWPIADIAAFAMLGKGLREQGIFTLYPEEKKKYYVKVPVFSFSKLQGMDAYLSPEMKSTGEAMGCDRQLTRALYKALQASGLHVQNYGTVFATIADTDKDEALPLIRRFYDLGFNIEATSGTAAFLKENGIRTHVCAKLSEGSGEILDSIRSGHVTYVINTRDLDSPSGETDGMRIRRCATENNVAIFTSLDTVRVLLDVLEEMTICVETLGS